MLLINPDWVSTTAFGNRELIYVDNNEAHAANALRVGDNLVYPANFPRTMEKLANRGIKLIPIEISELQKAEGAVTCCSLVFNT